MATNSGGLGFGAFLQGLAGRIQNAPTPRDDQSWLFKMMAEQRYREAAQKSVEQQRRDFMEEQYRKDKRGYLAQYVIANPQSKKESDADFQKRIMKEERNYDAFAGKKAWPKITEAPIEPKQKTKGFDFGKLLGLFGGGNKESFQPTAESFYSSGNIANVPQGTILPPPVATPTPGYSPYVAPPMPTDIQTQIPTDYILEKRRK